MNNWKKQVQFVSVMAPFVLAAMLSRVALAQSSPKTDATFAFTADVHVSFDGINDMEGFLQQDIYLPWWLNETATDISLLTSHAGCYTGALSFAKDLCNQIQLARKLNALPQQTWRSGLFPLDGHNRSLASQGTRIAKPDGLIVGGDLTDCGGGNSGNGNCPGYAGRNNKAQLSAFQAIFDDVNYTGFPNLDGLPFLPGLTKPGKGLPLSDRLYPGLGNHDIDDPGISNLISDYITEVVQANRNVVNFDQQSTSYSWNWGDLHVINVGVYPGSGNNFVGSDSDNYVFSQEAMTWFQRDLEEYASAGQPVIIAAHFGFDDTESLLSSWWGSSDRVASYNALWNTLRNYNVIGYFHGHNHIQWGAYKFPYDGVAKPNSTPLPKVPYDIFLPGAGYSQNFAVARVTDSRMDVMITQTSDFDGSSVVFGKGIPSATTQGLFTKILAPQPALVASHSDRVGDTLAVSFTLGSLGPAYAVSVNDSAQYGIRTINPFSNILSGTLPVPGAPSYMTSYTLPNEAGIAHVLMHYATSFDLAIDFKFNQRTKTFVEDWRSTSLNGAGMMSFQGADDNLYLLVDDTLQEEVFKVFQITSTGLTLAQQTPVVTENTKSKFIAGNTQLAPFAFYEGSGVPHEWPVNASFGRENVDRLIPFVRFVTTTGQLQYLSLDRFTLAVNLPLDSNEQPYEEWYAPGRMAVINAVGAQQIVLMTAPCTGCVSPDSPFYLLTMVPDQTGTDVSYRGNVSGEPRAYQMTDVFPVGQSPFNFQQFGAYSSLGLLALFHAEPMAEPKN